jgi:hypothetical protein
MSQDQEAMIADLERKNLILKDALLSAWRDIREWMILAKHQRSYMEPNSPPCPTESGIVRSQAVLDEIGRALRGEPR